MVMWKIVQPGRIDGMGYQEIDPDVDELVPILCDVEIVNGEKNDPRLRVGDNFRVIGINGMTLTVIRLGSTPPTGGIRVLDMVDLT